jgi:hypothetical protein
MEVPDVKVVKVELKCPVLLLELQVIVPVGLDPDNVAVQVTEEPTETGLGESDRETEVGDPVEVG